MTTVERLAGRLISLTVKDKLYWQKAFFNAHRSVWGGYEFYVEIFQDDKPLLSIDHIVIQGYGLGIEKLYLAIRNQYQRSGRYDYSKEIRDDYEKQKASRNKQKEQASKLFRSHARKLLQVLPK